MLFPTHGLCTGIERWGELNYERDDEHKAVEGAKSQCQENGWAGLSVAKGWRTIYFKWEAHKFQCDGKYTTTENPEKSVHTYMWLTEEEAAIWKARKEEYQTWREVENNKNKAYEEFEKGASWFCDFREKLSYQQPDAS